MTNICLVWTHFATLIFHPAHVTHAGDSGSLKGLLLQGSDTPTAEFRISGREQGNFPSLHAMCRCCREAFRACLGFYGSGLFATLWMDVRVAGRLAVENGRNFGVEAIGGYLGLGSHEACSFHRFGW